MPVSNPDLSLQTTMTKLLSRKPFSNSVVAMVLITAGIVVSGCRSNTFESGVLVETEPCATNIGPWNGLNEHKIRNDDGSLTVYKCHFKQAVSLDTPCPGIGDPLCESNWARITIGTSSAEVTRYLGDPLSVSGLRWQYPNNNSLSVDNGTVVNVFQRSASLYSQ